MSRVQLPSSKSNEQVLQDAFALLQCEKWGGASSKGWSWLQDYLRCPYRFYLKRIAQVSPTLMGGSSESQDIGSYGHAILAAHYAGQLPDKRYVGYRENCPTPAQVIDALDRAGADAFALNEATRCWDGYIDRWGDDGLITMAVEMPVGDPNLHTSRYDAVFCVEDGIHDGFWIGEHKFLSPSADLDSYNLDGEILGECLSWRLSGLDEVFGPLSGVLLNVALKKKVPAYHRLWMPVDWNRIDEYARMRECWNLTIESSGDVVNAGCEPTLAFPRSHYGCMARFDKCLYWDHCSTLSNSFLTKGANK